MKGRIKETDISHPLVHPQIPATAEAEIGSDVVSSGSQALYLGLPHG